MASTSEHPVPSPLSRWQWICHWLGRLMRFVWVVVIVGVAVSTISAVLTATPDTPLNKSNMVHLVLSYPVQLLCVAGGLVGLTILSWVGGRERHRSAVLSPAQQDRVRFLERLRRTYNELLSHSLQGAVWLDLGLIQTPGAVLSTTALLVRSAHRPEHPIPPDVSLLQVYDDAAHELLILGEPGAGKSTLLVHLAQQLVERAEHEGTHLMPVLLPLSSWAVTRPPLHDWMCEQLAQLYDVSSSLAQRW